MTPKELAAEIMRRRFKFENENDPTGRNEREYLGLMIRCQDTILAALEAYDKIESFADWLALYPEDLRLANCKFKELFDFEPLPKPPEGE